MNFIKLSRILPGLLLAAVLLTAVLPAAAFPSYSLAIQATPPSPIWGSKPVLGYFLLTAGIAEQLRQEVGLDEDQFHAAVEIARQEVAGLLDLEASSGRIMADPDRNLLEKRQWVVDSGYNRQVSGLLESSKAALSGALGPAAYARLVDWIEARWVIERQLHGTDALNQPAQASGPAAARTYRVYATRFDSNDNYIVAIPDKCIKLANGGAQKCSGYEYGQNYSVRLQYQGGPAVKVIVGESGPWNVDDNFWTTVADPQPRRLFTDLPLGMPEAQAAYFDNYNGGLDQFGRQVTSPVAIDLARQVSIDIGLQPGKNDWIDVTYLWTEGWVSGEVQEVTVKTPTKLQPAYSNDMCGSAWHKIDGFSGSPAYLTLNVKTPAESTNSAEWTASLPASGEYRVEAFVPDHPPLDWQCPNKTISRDTAAARYTVVHAGGQKEVGGNQGPLANGWLDLGTYTFDAGSGAKVMLSDLTGEESLSRTVAFSAVRFVRIDAPTPQPSPTPAPTATPTPLPPDPTLWAGSASLDPGGSGAVPIQVLALRGLTVGSVTLDLSYDPTVISPTACQPDPAGLFDSESCDLDVDRDGVAPDTLRLTLASAGGVAEPVTLANLTFQAAGAGGAFSPLEIQPLALAGPGGAALPVRAAGGLVCLTPCRNLAYMPILPRLFNWTP
jgi:hypothetical protein